MKSLTSFISEKFEAKADEELLNGSAVMVESETEEDSDEEPKEEAKTVTFDLNGIDGGTDVLNSIKSICSGANIKQDTSNLNTGIKITATKDKAGELEKIAEIVQEFISSVPDEEHEGIADKLVKLSKSLDTLNELLDGYGNEEELYN